MKTLKISYNPYKMSTAVHINGVDVCELTGYDKFSEFIKNRIPLQTWIEPIPHLGWQGLVNEVSDPEINDAVKVAFYGRKIDFEDLKRSIEAQNEKRSERTRVKYQFHHEKTHDDEEVSENIEKAVRELKSDRFRELVQQRKTEGLKQKYKNLDANYKIAVESEFYIVFAGVYSSGKSTLLNTLIRHDILPTSNKTCTSRNCRIRHDGRLGCRVSLVCRDKDDKIVVEKRVFDHDADCKAAFLEVCPDQDGDAEDKYPDVSMMELGVDLSHLYPHGVVRDKFTIVLVDTPGVNSTQSIKNGENEHANIALDAISMESKPMIVLCVDAANYEAKSIGEFMRDILDRSKEEGGGFNDRFLFLMNKIDKINYNAKESPEDTKGAFARYLTDPSKWSIKDDDEELEELAKSAARFVPRVFMTAAQAAFAIQQGAHHLTEEDAEDGEKCNLLDAYDDFKRKICDRKREKYYLSRYCDIPDYRKKELEAEFWEVIKENEARATELQCGVISVESAIRDYIERYAYPIKVRGLLDTFEDILVDVKSFTSAYYAELQKAEEQLGEKESERKEAGKEKRGVKDKTRTLETVKKQIDKQLKELKRIQFDSITLKRTISELVADIEADEDIRFIRENQKVETGQKSRSEVEAEINSLAARIQELFERIQDQTKTKLEEIKKVHDKQLLDIFNVLKDAIDQLEKSGVLEEGAFSFEDSVLWKMNFKNLNADSFASDMMKEVVDRSTETKLERNSKKDEFSRGNLIQRIMSMFMKKNIPKTVRHDGHYETTEIRKHIDECLFDLQAESKKMEKYFEGVMEDSKRKVKDLVGEVKSELDKFYADINDRKKRIKELSESEKELGKEIKAIKGIYDWLGDLEKSIEGGIDHVHIV